MTLDWDVTKIENQSVCWTPIDNINLAMGLPIHYIKNDLHKMSWKTYALIHLSMVCQWGWHLNTANAETAYVRVHLYERLFGAFHHEPDGKPIYITPQDIQDHIGLWTNGGFCTFPSYKNRMILNFMMDQKGIYQKSLTEEEKENGRPDHATVSR